MSEALENLQTQEEISPVHTAKASEFKPNSKKKLFQKTQQDLEWEAMMGKPKPKRRTGDPSQRFAEFQTRKQERLSKLADEQAKAHESQCTFQPSTNPDAGRRSVNQFLKEQEKFQRRKEERLEELRMQKQLESEAEASSSSFHPSLCKRSIALSQRSQKHSESVYEKLFTASKASVMQTEDRDAFIPAVNPKSKELIRREPVSQLLYKDALRRQQKEVSAPVRSEVSASAGSQRVLMEKLAREIDQEFGDLDLEDTGLLNYSSYLALLENMRMLTLDVNHPRYSEERELALRSWQLIAPSDGGYVHKENVVILLFCVMNLCPGTDRNLDSSVSSLGTLVDNEFQVTEEEAKRIHRQFLPLYDNRNTLKKKPAQAPEQFSFKPALQQHTERLAEKARSKYNDVASELKRRQESLERKRQEQEEKLQQECTFRPKISEAPKSNAKFKDGSMSQQWQQLTEGFRDRNAALYQLSKVKREMKSETLTTEEKRLQESLNECSFKPQLSKPTEALRRPEVVKTAVQPEAPSFNEESVEDDEIITISVDLPTGGTGELVIKPEDDKRGCVEDFIAKYNIGGEIAYQLRTDVLDSLL